MLAENQILDSKRTQEFVVMGYEGLRLELKSSEGPYIQTLMELMGVNQNERATVLEKIRSLLKANKNIMDFADQVLLLQNKNSSSQVVQETPVLVPSGPSIHSGRDLENALNHITRGMQVTVYLKGGGQFTGQYQDYSQKKLLIRGKEPKRFSLDQILAIDVPQL